MPNDLPSVARANRALAAAWRSGLLPRPRLEADALEAAALRAAPPSALGAERWWREPFGRLLDALRDEARLNPLGEAMAHGQIVMTLRARMRAAKLWRRRPEIRMRPVAAPIIVLGQMRSGTTRMQRLLACDERFVHTRLDESLIPVPRPGRRLLARLGLTALGMFNPEIARIHPTSPSAPEEEFGLLSFSFGSALFEAQWRVPAFARWWEAADTRPLYREFRALLQTAGWANRDAPDRPRLLKVPQFMQDLESVLDTFPDARLIRLHREPQAVVASSASLVWHQMRVQSDAADRAWIGREWLRKTRLREQRAEAALAARPDVPVVQVEYEAMNRDWSAEMERIYDFLGLELTPPVHARMAAYLRSARSHLGHRYSLAEFGLTERDFVQ